MTHLTITNQTPVQTNFLGNGAVYHGYAGLPDCDGRVYSETLCELEADRTAALGLKIARTFYGYWAWDKQTRSWNWETPTMQAFYRWLDRMKKRNIKIALNTGWWLQFDLDGHNSPFYANGSWQGAVKNFSNWVSESYKQLVENRGFTNITTFVLFTEPNCGFGNQGMWQKWGEVVQCVHQTLLKAGQRDKILLMGPNEGSGRLADMCQWLSQNQELKNVIDIYSSHCYLEDYVIPPKYLKTGSVSVALLKQGGRFCQTVALKPHTSYVVTAYAALLREGQNAAGTDYFGVFENDGRNDIHSAIGHGPGKPLTDTSVNRITKAKLKQELTPITVCFKTGEQNSGVVGWFHDITGEAGAVIDHIVLTEENGTPVPLQNPNFENGLNGWFYIYCGGTANPYRNWFLWAKTGLQYAPKGKLFCFDEYNISYEKDFSRPEHGAQIVTAAIAMMNAGVNLTLLWTLFDQQWPNNHTSRPGDCFFNGEHRWGIMPSLTRSLIPHPSYYAFGLLSKFTFGNGSTIYAGEEKNLLCVTMNVSKTGEVTVVAANAKETADEFCLHFEKPLQKTLYRYTFDPKKLKPSKQAALPESDAVFNGIQQTLQDVIAPHSVVVYTTCRTGLTN